MYQSFFGLEQQPFGLTPNTSLYYGLPPHEEAMEVLHTALVNGEGFIKVTGEVGTGKTMVLRLFISKLEENYELVYIPNPTLNPLELKQSIAKELQLDVENISNLSLNDLINNRLLDLNKSGKKVVMVVDEAQALSDETLETVRLLGNLETEQDKMLQIVLFGQPELDLKLQQDNFRQLRQRISFSYALRPLNEHETYSYLNYRMKASGFKGVEVFDSKVARDIYVASYGIPRLINVIANKCLMLCYGFGVYAVTRKIVAEAIKDTNEVTKDWHHPRETSGFYLVISIITMILATVGGCDLFLGSGA